MRLPGPFHARPAPGDTPLRHFMRSMRQVVVFWGFFLAVMPAALVAIESKLGIAAPFLQSSWIFYSALIVLALVSIVGLLSGISMARCGDGTPLPAACATKLVVVGPYAYIRNPMAACGIAQGAMIGLLLASPLTVGYALCGAFVWNCIVRPVEEQDLVERFGEEYEAYHRAVRCWLPHLRRYCAPTLSEAPADGPNEGVSAESGAAS